MVSMRPVILADGKHEIYHAVVRLADGNRETCHAVVQLAEGKQ